MTVPVWAVVLAGGVGSRFWPLSTPARPKQLLPLASDQPMLADTLGRLAPIVPTTRTLVLTSESLAAAVRAAAPALEDANVLAEPRPAGTAAALAYAASVVRQRSGGDAVMICVHADWSIGDPAGFRAALARAADVAVRTGKLVTVGVVPSRPDPGFGYIEPGALLASANAPRATAGGTRASTTAEPAVDEPRRVARFVEKPDRAAAARMIEAGYLWNSGIFVWRAGDFLDEVARHTPEIACALPELDGRAGEAARFFGSVEPVSVDVGVLERSDRVVVIPGDFGWDDVGTWAALHRVRTRDASGNVTHGPVHAVDSERNVVYADACAVVLYGVAGLIVVSRPGVTLVTTPERSSDLKTLLDSLPPSIRNGAA